MATNKILAWSLFLLFLKPIYAHPQNTPESKNNASAAQNKVIRPEERDAEALAFLLNSYEEVMSGKKWAPSAAPLRSVRKKIFVGPPTTTTGAKMLWPDDKEGKKWPALLGSQPSKESGQTTASVPIAIFLVKESSSFGIAPNIIKITTTTVSGGKSKIETETLSMVEIFFGRNFYTQDFYIGRGAAEMGASAGKDLLDDWKRPGPKTLRSEVELKIRFFVMAEIIWRLNFLLQNDNLQKINKCLYEPDSIKSDVEIKNCAAILWDYELGASQITVKATEEISYCVEPGGCKKPEDYAHPIKKDMELFIYPQPGMRSSKSGLKQYVRARLHKINSKVATLCNKIWEKHK